MANGTVIAERIRRLLSLRKMSQRALARSIGTSDAAVSKYLSGERPIRPQALWAIARALGASESYILGESDEPQMRGKDDELADALAIIERNREAMSDAEKIRFARALFKETPPTPSQEEPSDCPTCQLQHST